MRRLLLLVLLPLAVPTAAAAAAPAVPPEAVAKVGTQAPVTRADLDRWIEIAAAAEDELRGVPRPVPRVGTRDWRALADPALQFLISNRWIEGETGERGITVSPVEVRGRFERVRRENYPKAGTYEAFLRATRMTEDDLLLRVRIDLLSERLRRAAAGAVEPSTRAERLAYFRANRSRFAVPERWIVRVISNRSRAKVVAAMRARRAGRSWTSVARAYGQGTTRRNGGRRVTDGEFLDYTVSEAIRTAEPGVLTGPVHGDVEWYAFVVERVIPSRVPRFAEVEERIRQELQSQREQAALDRFVQAYRARWRSRTACRLPAGMSRRDCGTLVP